MSQHAGHRYRVRRQFIEHGLDPYPDHEVLELLLFYAIPRQDTEALSYRLLQRFGSLNGVFNASLAELKSVEGVGENTAVLLQLVPAVYRRSRLSAAREQETAIVSVESAGQYFLDLFIGKTEEELYALCLDKKGKVLSCRCISQGCSSALSVSIRKIVEEALNIKASAVILAHNHPSGVALPSEADNRTTLDICDALRTVGITLLDHIIVADGDYVSLAANGLFH